MTSFAYRGDLQRGCLWARLFAERMPAIDFRVVSELEGDVDATVHYLGTWAPLADYSRFPSLKVIFALGAGVDQFDLSLVPPGVALVRLEEPGIVGMMQDYATLAVMALHRDLPIYLEQQRRGAWSPEAVLPAARRRVGILGLGQMGAAVAARLTALGFSCSGWSRTPKALPDVRCHAGNSALGTFLAESEILVCLLPLTAATRGFLNAALFAALPTGASLVNMGRGGHLRFDDLVAAFDRGQLAGAVLDVFEPEPPPPGHPVWSHQRILLTPHVGSVTNPESAIEAVIANIARHRAGEPMRGEIDRLKGY